MTTTTLRRTIAAVSLTGLLAISLTGCFGEDDADTDASPSPTPELGAGIAGGGGGAGAGSTDDDSADNEPTDDNDSSDEQPQEPAPEPVALAGAECIYGTWIADNNSALAGMQQFGDEVQSVSGTVVVEYGADGSFTTDYQDWLITAQAEGVTVTIHRSGTDRGTFSATDDAITMTDQEMGATLVMDAGDYTMAVDAEPSSYADAPYTCSANELVINTPDGTAVLSR